jgi:hypothetical protein
MKTHNITSEYRTLALSMREISGRATALAKEAERLQRMPARLARQERRADALQKEYRDRIAQLRQEVDAQIAVSELLRRELLRRGGTAAVEIAMCSPLEANWREQDTRDRNAFRCVC